MSRLYTLLIRRSQTGSRLASVIRVITSDQQCKHSQRRVSNSVKAVKLGSSMKDELVAAIQAGQLQTVEALLSLSLPVRDYHLVTAVRQASPEILDAMLAHTDSMDVLSGQAQELLLDAALAENRPVVQKLLQLGVPVSADSLALQKCVFAGFRDISLDLLSASTDCWDMNFRLRMIPVVLRRDSLQILSRLLSGCTCHVWDESLMSAVATKAEAAVLQAILAAGEAEGFFVRGKSSHILGKALCVMIGLRQDEGVIGMIHSLLASGASLGQLNDAGFSALMMAAYHQDIKVLQLLIRSGADVNLTSAEGKSALWFAITAAQQEATVAHQQNPALSAYWSRDTAAMLLSNGADVDAADHAGITPLMLAASIQSDTHATPLIDLLCQNGARAQLQDNRGETALMKAAATGPFTSANLLLQAISSGGLAPSNMR